MTKDATVSAQIDETVKNQAEDILKDLGIPVSVVIITLYHQIIILKGIHFPMTLLQTPSSPDGISRTELDARLQHSYDQALSRQGRPLSAVFADLERKHA